MARSKQNWINIEDGIPLDSDLVRVERLYTASGETEFSVDSFSNGEWLTPKPASTVYVITRWMPIPTGGSVEV